MEQSKARLYALVSALMVGLVILAGCAGATLQPHQEALAKAATQYATIKFIDGDVDRAEKVKEVTAFAVEFASGDATTTVAALEMAVRAHIHWERLKPEDALVLNTLITAVRIELEARLTDTDLGDADDVVLQVVEVLEWVNEAASLYLPSSEREFQYRFVGA